MKIHRIHSQVKIRHSRRPSNALFQSARATSAEMRFLRPAPSGLNPQGNVSAGDGGDLAAAAGGAAAAAAETTVATTEGDGPMAAQAVADQVYQLMRAEIRQQQQRRGGGR